MKRPKMIDAHVFRLASSDLRKPRGRQLRFVAQPVRAYPIRGPFPFLRVLAHRPIGAMICNRFLRNRAATHTWYLTDAKTGCSLVWGGMSRIDELLADVRRRIAAGGISQQKAAASRTRALRESKLKPLNTGIPDSAYQPWPGDTP